MKNIPKDKLKFYSEQHQSLRYLRKQLQTELFNSKINLHLLSQLEITIVTEAFQNIAKQGNEILITFDHEVYTQDLKKIKTNKYNTNCSTIYLLCNREGCLQDIAPLLPFVSPKKRKEYKVLRNSI